MAKARGLRTVINLLLIPVLLLLLWTALGQPMPSELNYRRLERAMLLEPMQILDRNEQLGLIISGDETHMAAFCEDWSGGTIRSNQFLLTETENGIGLITDWNSFYGLSVWAYDAQKQASRVEMELILIHEEYGSERILQEVEKQGDVFYLFAEAFDPWSVNWRDQTMESLAYYEMEKDRTVENEYQLKITFYDQAGNVTAVRESGYER